MSSKKWLQLMDHGRELLKKKDIPGAEQAFTKALAMQEDVSARNNLAMVIFHQDDAGRALAVLEPNLDSGPSPGNPFSFALAAQILSALERKKEARRHLDTAVTQFERGRARLDEMDVVKESWYEYTMAIMKGAAALEDHRLVLELYKRWERYHVTWENRYLAGVASFNLRRHGRAASLWGSVTDAGPFAIYMQQVAFLVERGLVPPFPLEYEQPDPGALQSMAKEATPEDKEAVLSLYAGSGSVRMQTLAYLFSTEIEEKEAGGLLVPLIQYGGDWGEAFGLRLLEAGGVPKEFKFNAAFALVQRGVFEPGEPIPMIIDGKEETVEIQQKTISLEPDPELDRLDEQARELRDKGRLEEAIVLLEPLYEQGRYYPATMVTLANLYRSLERFDQARKVLETLEAMLPDHPLVLFNLAGLWVERGDYQRSLEYLDRLDEAGPDEDIAARADRLRGTVEMRLEMKDPAARRAQRFAYEDEEREDIEKKALPVEASLLRGLKNMPNHWLYNICDIFGLKRGRQRREREQLIAAYLVREAVLKKVVTELEEAEQELLRYLLERSGWARLNEVTRKFGPMEGDGYYWLDEEPESPLGYLWSCALVMVGQAKLESGSARVALVPADLRETLARILGVTPGGAKEAAADGKSNGKTALPAAGGKNQVMLFRVTLTDRTGKVQGYPYRTLAVPADFTLYRLALAILDAFDFDEDHAFGFYDDIKHWTRSREGYELFADIGEKQIFPGLKKVKITRVFPELKKEMLFLYDYGDDWHFIVQLKKVVAAKPGQTYPAVLEQFDPAE